jgi:parallel beta-helix repeat protein
MKWFALLGLVLFLGVAVAPSITAIDDDRRIQPQSNGNTLYVGGAGLGNYSKIQYAIDNASDRDTVYVFNDSSPYYENINITSRISLIGEKKESTIIDGKGIGNVVHLLTDGTTVSGFTIQNCGNNDLLIESDAGIKICGNDSIIFNNIIQNNQVTGLMINKSSGNTINRNIFHNNYHEGILVHYYSSNNAIVNNQISNTINGIFFNAYCNNNSIYNNTITDCLFTSIQFYGECNNNSISYNKCINENFRLLHLIIKSPSIWMYKCYNNTIIRNSIINKGIFRPNIELIYCSDCIIKQNNFHSRTILSYFYGGNNNTWNGNYWFRPRISPKIIQGRTSGSDNASFMFTVDWYPAQEPYDIG